METFSHAMEIAIDAPMETVWRLLITKPSEWWLGYEGAPMQMAIEPWPGGRLYRDLGDDNGHFWATVQVIKRPYLIEFAGPMFMSGAVLAHLSFRLEEAGEGSTKLTMSHAAIGTIPESYREGADRGWANIMKGLKDYVGSHTD